jgi:hypothetical protein
MRAVPELVKYREKIEEAKADIAVYLGRRLTELFHETAIEIKDLNIHTANIRRGTGSHVKDIAVTDVSLILTKGQRA